MGDKFVKKIEFLDPDKVRETLRDLMKRPTVSKPNDFRPFQERINTYINNFVATYILCKKDADKLVAEYNKLLHNYRKLRVEEAKLSKIIERHNEALAQRKINAQFDEERARAIETETEQMVKEAQERQEAVKEMNAELMIKQDELEQAVEDMDLALSRSYTLSESEVELFERRKPLILKGLEETGSVWGALQKYPEIGVHASHVMWYSQKFESFRQDVEIATQLFKDKMHGTVLDRALNGTLTPIFQKGEHLGDFNIPDNKLLVEAAKAVVPEKYDRRQASSASGGGGVTANNVVIQNFSQVNEADLGYTKNIGVVTHVDERGQVKRIQEALAFDGEAKKDDVRAKELSESRMVEFYKDKPGAQIIEVEVDGETKLQ